MLGYRNKVLISHASLFVLFTAFVFFISEFVEEKTLRFRIVTVGGGLIFLYSLLTCLVVYRLSRPLQKIIDAIAPHQDREVLPKICLEPLAFEGEFGKLALLLNSLIEKIEKQIERLKQQRKESEEILHSLSEGVIAVDIHGNTIFANRAASKMLGIDLPISRLDYFKSELVVKCHEVIQQVLQTSEPASECWERRENGRLYLELSAVPRIGHHGVILVIQNKTSDYKILDMGKDFIANASHELRTPITIIHGFAETIQDHPNLSPQLLAEMASKIVRTSGRLEKLMKSLLMLADMENFYIDQLQTIDLVGLAEQCKNLLLTSSPQVQIALHSDLPKVPIAADPLLLDLAIMNLLENAVKYSADPVHIDLSVAVAGDEAQIRVRDQGIGIPEGDLPHIFDRFYTVDKARSRKSGGAGLGLSIVKTIVEKHRGKVFAVSELGRGSVFTISLPVEKSSFLRKFESPDLLQST